MMKIIDRHQKWLLLAIASFVAITGSFSVFAGQPWGVIPVALLLIATTFTSQMRHETIMGLLESNKHTLSLWKRDTTYMQAISDEHIAVLHELAEHDPAKTSIYAARFRNRIEERNGALESPDQAPAEHN
jgi:hypothetical protein